MNNDIIGFSLILGIFSGCLFEKTSAQAQIIRDFTLPTPTQVTPAGNLFEVSAGTKSGINLFHSFEEFSILDNNTVRFINDDFSIKNVISRVTGSSLSEILGKIETAGKAPNVNLFLINPRGINFGSNATLNIGGSFVATTSSSIQFGKQGILEILVPNDPSLLNINPTAFFLNQIRSQPLISQAEMSVPSGNSILLLGGNINLNGGRLKALNGHIELGSLTNSGLVELNINGGILSLKFPDNVARGDVSLTNGVIVDVTDKGSGSIVINAQNIELSGGSELLAGIDSGNVADMISPGVIVIDATGEVILKDPQSVIDNSALDFSFGKGGDISITAESLTIKDDAGIVTGASGIGNAGDIELKIRKELVLLGSRENGFFSLIGSVVTRAGEGNSGNITVKSESILLSEGSIIRSNIFGRGNAGNISIHADDFVVIRDGIFVPGENNTLLPLTAQILTAVESGAVGNGGNIDISARSLNISGGGQLSSAVFGSHVSSEKNLAGGQGKSGNITIHTLDSVILSGVGIDGIASGIFTNVEDGASGAAGNVSIVTNSLQVSDGAEIKLSNLQGQAGNLTVTTNFLSLSKGVIIAEVGGNDHSNSANIDLTVLSMLKIANESQISAKAINQANGGNINIDTPILLALSPIESNGNDIIASAKSGSGGNITINAQGVFGIQQRKAIDGNQTNDIDASSQFGQSGQVQISTTTDPNQGVVELPLSVIDPNTLVAQNPCRRSSRSEFTRSGRGGLPPSLSQDLSGETTQVNLVEPTLLSAVKPEPQPASPKASFPSLSSSQIVPAQGWVYNDKGEVILVAYNSAITGSQRLQAPSAGCPVL